MADVSIVKAMLLQAAYEAAIAALENAAPVGADGKPLAVVADSTVQDPGLRSKNLAIYEVAKVHYAALVNAFQDQTGIWPDPKLPAASIAQPGVAVPSPGHDVVATLAGIANAVSTVIPQAGLAGQVAGVVSNALAPH